MELANPESASIVDETEKFLVPRSSQLRVRYSLTYYTGANYNSTCPPSTAKANATACGNSHEDLVCYKGVSMIHYPGDYFIDYANSVLSCSPIINLYSQSE